MGGTPEHGGQTRATFPAGGAGVLGLVGSLVTGAARLQPIRGVGARLALGLALLLRGGPGPHPGEGAPGADQAGVLGLHRLVTPSTARLALPANHVEVGSNRAVHCGKR